MPLKASTGGTVTLTNNEGPTVYTSDSARLSQVPVYIRLVGRKKYSCMCKPFIELILNFEWHMDVVESGI